ncbi:MAG: hypothetical protein JWP01_2218 [Myxococcales bacterium]|nr:hypothetical protein [Myxococcales bacterium]
MSEVDRYRLAPVRDARSREERLRRGDLADAASIARASEAQVAAAAGRVAEARAALEAARTAQRELVTSGTTSLALSRTEQFIVRRRRDLDAAIDAHARAEASHRGQLDQVDAARNQLARARADKEIIERHFTRWRTAKARLAERRED